LAITEKGERIEKGRSYALLVSDGSGKGGKKGKAVRRPMFSARLTKRRGEWNRRALQSGFAQMGGGKATSSHPFDCGKKGKKKAEAPPRKRGGERKTELLALSLTFDSGKEKRDLKEHLPLFSLLLVLIRRGKKKKRLVENAGALTLNVDEERKKDEAGLVFTRKRGKDGLVRMLPSRRTTRKEEMMSAPLAEKKKRKATRGSAYRGEEKKGKEKASRRLLSSSAPEKEKSPRVARWLTKGKKRKRISAVFSSKKRRNAQV